MERVALCRVRGEQRAPKLVDHARMGQIQAGLGLERLQLHDATRTIISFRRLEPGAAFTMWAAAV